MTGSIQHKSKTEELEKWQYFKFFLNGFFYQESDNCYKSIVSETAGYT